MKYCVSYKQLNRNFIQQDNQLQRSGMCWKHLVLFNASDTDFLYLGLIIFNYERTEYQDTTTEVYFSKYF
jgi:hypothetical protein